MTGFKNKNHIFDPSLPIYPLMEKSNPIIEEIFLCKIVALKQKKPPGTESKWLRKFMGICRWERWGCFFIFIL